VNISVERWLSLHTKSVLSAFLTPLSHHPEWRQLYFVSPWISEFGEEAGMSFPRLLRKLATERVVMYVATRPPTEDWHARAIDRLKDTGKASISLVPQLHAKLYVAETAAVSFALLGSANLTKASLTGIELGILIHDSGPGKHAVRLLQQHATELYRMPGRTLLCTARI
jgi:hypothetical protein